jgi:hypothetical protein
MPTNKPKLFHVAWREILEHSALVETDWTTEEIQAHALSSEHAPEGDEGRPIWQFLIEEQILDPRDHIVGRELELVNIERVSPLHVSAESLPRDKMIEIVNAVREALLREKTPDTCRRIFDVFVQAGLDPTDEGVWGVLGANAEGGAEWLVHLTSEGTARSFWEANEGTWKLCTSITKDKAGDTAYVTMEEREQNAPAP